MNFSEIVNSIAGTACIISVEKLADDEIGELHIVAANKGYRDSMPKYYDGILYSELFPRERKFEHFVSSSALKHKEIHTYVESKTINKWMEQFYIPLVSDRDDIGYCIFTYEITDDADPDRIGNVTMDTAESVIKSCAVFRTADSFNVAVDAVVKELYEKCSAKSVTVVSIDEMTQRLKFISGMSEDADRDEHERRIKAIPSEVVKTWAKTLGQSNCLLITDEADMGVLRERNPEWADSLKGAGADSLCFVPLFQNNSIIGYLYVINFDVSRTIQIKELLEHTSFFLAAELANNNLMEKMKILSNVDSLTGVYNRNAMNMRVDEFVSNANLRLKPYGVAFIDLNGLKIMNDKYGHEAGDQMLWSAANIISSVFDKEEIYRAGGDEFSVISILPSEEFMEKIKQLREKTTYPADITMSIGYHYSLNGDDIRISMKMADQEMYKDKEEFYKEHPELKSRTL
ncbi:diguanylate cyclase domain-containing protein [Butyrivibrio sp. JL13D10]|uniref:sensor domain-containing diguanylate cyclase n=1 Tax=Butyrivibrio sp. JL13D10 TaxID=3236815 RepID=UPI0038B5F6A1